MFDNNLRERSINSSTLSTLIIKTTRQDDTTRNRFRVKMIPRRRCKYLTSFRIRLHSRINIYLDAQSLQIRIILVSTHDACGDGEDNPS